MNADDYSIVSSGTVCRDQEPHFWQVGFDHSENPVAHDARHFDEVNRRMLLNK